MKYHNKQIDIKKTIKKNCQLQYINIIKEGELEWNFAPINY